VSRSLRIVVREFDTTLAPCPPDDLGLRFGAFSTAMRQVGDEQMDPSPQAPRCTTRGGPGVRHVEMSVSAASGVAIAESHGD
jgi:hypothetical protein